MFMIDSRVAKLGAHGSAVVFPGQGAQSSGMGRRAYETSQAARDTYSEASEIVGVDLAKICFESDEDALASTHNTQPAVLTTSLATYRAMKEKLNEINFTIDPQFFGGHSMGMFTAADASGALSLKDSLGLILERSRLMGSFNEARPVGMAAIIGLEYDVVAEVCSTATSGPENRVDVANHNEDLQTVISGDVAALERAMGIVKGKHGKAIRLKLKVSSHTPLHESQASEFAEIVRKVDFKSPCAPIVSNIGSHLMVSGIEVRNEFEDQLKSPVMWASNVRKMISEGIELFIEAGPGHSLSRMIRRINSTPIAVSLDAARQDPIPISIFATDSIN